MREIQFNLKQSLEVPEHQNFMNLEHLNFDKAGSISKFHVEYRFPDGDLSPVSIIAKTFLFLVMLLKSVEISKFGLLHVGKMQDWKRKKELLNLISNNDGELATSDTARINQKILKEYKRIALQLLKFMKSIFIILDNPSEIILYALAERPISVRRIEGDDWLKIDADLTALIEPVPSLDQLDYRIIKLIELGLVEGKNYDEWLIMAAIKSFATKETIQLRIDGYKNRGPV